MKKLQREFYDRDTLIVSKELLGKYLVHKIDNQTLIGKIVEVEAYNGPEDKACHSFGNKMTNRNKVMFGPPGFAYVYTIYGMYQCMNVVTEEDGRPCAVLIRAIEPVEGIEQMAVNRYGSAYDELSRIQKKNITNGPGKLCIAMKIDKSNNGMDLFSSNLYIEDSEKISDNQINSSPRINIGYAEEYVQMPWRFYIKGNKYVSKL